MKWPVVRRMHPNQYVKLNIIDFYLEGDKKIVTDVALINVVDEIGIYFENGDRLVSSYGFGGEDYSFSKPVDFIKLGNYEIPDMKLDFGNLNDWGINRLIGLDILMNEHFIIDLGKLELIQN